MNYKPIKNKRSMVLQRLQSLLLFLAFALMIVFCFVPFCQGTAYSIGLGRGISVSECPTLLGLGIASAVLLFVTIFLFKNLKAQKSALVIDMVLTAVTAIMTVFSAQTDFTEVVWYGAFALAVIALVLEIIALTRINHDERLLRESSRLR